MPSPFLQACRLRPVSPTPVWILRQAGRYMAEYRKVRAKVSFSGLCKDPALCAEVAVTARRRLGVDAAIVFAPVGALVVHALANVRKGGVVVCGGIHMSDIPSFPYELLWGERCLRSVANLTRADGQALLPLAAEAGVRTEVKAYPFEQANAALADLRDGRLEGAAVLQIPRSR